jgi:hypothetical protein
MKSVVVCVTLRSMVVGVNSVVGVNYRMLKLEFEKKLHLRAKRHKTVALEYGVYQGGSDLDV